MFRKTYGDLSRTGKSKRRKKIKGEMCTQNLLPESKVTEGISSEAEDSDSNDVPHISNLNSVSEEETLGYKNCPGTSYYKDNDEDLFDLDLDPSSDSDDEHFDDRNRCDLLKENLRDWVNKFKVEHLVLASLLSILKTHECLNDLPTDPRTFLNTPRKVITRVVEPGNYAHIGLEASLRKLWGKVTETITKIELLIGIDGLPLFKSSTCEIWPILGMVCNIKSLRSLVFPIGIYCGKSKPKDSNSFLSEFILELNKIIDEGFSWKGQVITVSIKGFILDAPAKSFILNTKGHTGYYSCTKCVQRGTWISNRMTFQDNNAPKRTHGCFLRKTDEDFHSSQDSILLETIPGINFIDCFPLDYMHLVCLGVVRTIMYLWLFSKPSVPRTIKLSAFTINSISHSLCSLKSHMPLEFNRKPRSLDEIKRWKATEYRQFLLYTGPVVLKEIFIDCYKPMYDHFLSLSISIYILLSPKLSTPENCDYADSLLKNFIDNTKVLYGEQYITHNVHGLTHLMDCYKSFGPMELGSAFPFENFLQFFKSLIRKGEKPLEQVVKRCSEIMNSNCWFNSSTVLNDKFPTWSQNHCDGPVLPTSDVSQQFSRINFQFFAISRKHPNNCCILTSGRIIIVENIVYSHHFNKMVVIFREFLEKSDFYTSPFISSSDLGVFLLSNPSPLQEVPVDDIEGKIVLMPFKNKKVGVPLLHCF